MLQILRRHRYPVAGHVLAGELGISLRTLYRDIATLRQQGAHIEGGAGARRCCASGVNGKASPRSERLLPEDSVEKVASSPCRWQNCSVSERGGE
ncbi:HTH domain-containing protein [Pseudomonas aeruginosa]|uniref:HTH domain-containing protein n=1 Tax=Pseudomonas aeruginosa TaxID=287 RepID=UPI003992825C